MTTQSHMLCHVKGAIQRTLIVIRLNSWHSLISSTYNKVGITKETLLKCDQKNWSLLNTFVGSFLVHYAIQ